MSRNSTSIDASLVEGLVIRVENLIIQAERSARPLEIEPFHGQLFELFVTADAAMAVDEGLRTELTADGICRALAERWGLADATRQWFEQQAKLPPEQLSRMRMLWSVMRMWIEWSYAWQRWDEFHKDTENSKR